MRPHHLGILSWVLLAIGLATSAGAETIGGTVFEDTDFLGTPAAYDSAADFFLPNVEVELYRADNDAFLQSTTTDANGAWSFTVAGPDSFKVRVVSATIGDSDTRPATGVYAWTPIIYANPLPEMSWARGQALLGGQDPDVDDTDTPAGAGPGDTWIQVFVAGSDVLDIDFGFAWNLVVNVQDDTQANPDRSQQGSLRMAIKNMISMANDVPNSCDEVQFHLQVPPNITDGGDSWWRITLAGDLLDILDKGATFDGDTQIANSGMERNSRGPEIELYGPGLATAFHLVGDRISILNLGVVGFDGTNGAGVRIDGDEALVAGCHLGINAVGTDTLGNRHGIRVTATASRATIGDPGGAGGNLCSGNQDHGIFLDGSGPGTRVRGNKLGTDRTGLLRRGNLRDGIQAVGVDSLEIGGMGPGEGNLIGANLLDGIELQSCTNATIDGNDIGVGADGTTALGNGQGGILVQGTSADIAIGTPGPNPSNVICDSRNDGIMLWDQALRVTVRNNIVGTNRARTAAHLGNGDSAVLVNATVTQPGHVIGGPGLYDGNLLCHSRLTGGGAVGTASGVIFEGNTTRDNRTSGFWVQSDSVVIQSNLVLFNGTSSTNYGIGVLSSTTGVVAYHNTVHGSSGYGIGHAGAASVVRNNIITGSGNLGLVSLDVTATSSHNLITDSLLYPPNAGGTTDGTLDPTDLVASPIYRDVAAEDFRLVACSSPAIDQGLDLGADQPDLVEGPGRFLGAAPDIGRFEGLCAPNSDLVASVVVDAPTPAELDTVAATLWLVNDGEDPATNASAHTDLGAGLDLVGATPSQGSYLAGTWTVGSVAVGDSASLLLELRPQAATRGTSQLVALVLDGSDLPDNLAANDSSGVLLNVVAPPEADLATAINVSEFSTAEGDTLSATLVLRQLGPDPTTGATATVGIAAGLDLLSYSSSQGAFDGTTWSPAALSAADSATLWLQLRPKTGTRGSQQLVWMRSEGSNLADPVAANDSTGALLSIVAPPEADLLAKHSLATTSVVEGDTLDATLWLQNLGPDPIVNASGRLLLGQKLELISTLPDQGNYSAGDWWTGPIASGDSVRLDIRIRPLPGSAGLPQLVGLRTQFSDPTDPVATNDSTGVMLDILATPSVDLRMVARVDQLSPLEGSTVQAELVVHNNSGAVATSIRAHANLDDWLDLLSSAPSQGGYSAGDWLLGSLAPGDSATLVLNLRPRSGSGGLTQLVGLSLDASSPPDSDESNNSAFVSLNIQALNGSDPVVVFRPVSPGGTLLPAGPAREVARQWIRNDGNLVRSLQGARFHNLSTGEGSPAELDASWLALELSAQDAFGNAMDLGSGSGTSRVATFSGGILDFGTLDLALAPGDSLALVLEGGASASARDGDALAVGLQGPNDLDWSGPVQTVGVGTPPPGLLVDGMAASQVILRDVGSLLPSGGQRKLVLDLSVPANGYLSDTLERINLRNRGSAIQGRDLEGLEAWSDNGDQIFDAASDSLLGGFAFTGERWEITGLNLAVPLSGRRIYISANLGPDALEGSSVQFELPALPDVGLGMASGNDGPVDRPVSFPTTQTISTQDRLSLVAVDLPANSAVPGIPDQTLLAFELHNTYADLHHLSALEIENRSTALPTRDQSSMDAVLENLRLYRDGGDGNFDPELDELLGVTSLLNGQARFDGMNVELPITGAQRFFVVADLSLNAAPDGDQLRLEIVGPLAVFTNETATVIGSWPLTSGSGLVVDGLVRRQLGVLASPSATLAPLEGEALALALNIPDNGGQNDRLHELRLVDIAGADPSNVGDLRLYRDGGDGAFGGDDLDLGALVRIGGRWQALDLDEPLPGRFHVGLTASGSLVEGERLQLSVPLNGLEVASGNDGPTDLPANSSAFIAFSESPLRLSMSVEEDSLSVGATTLLRGILQNGSNENIEGVAAILALGGSNLELVSGPNPPTLDLTPSTIDTFIWTVRATAPGTSLPEAWAAGTGQPSGLGRTTPTATTGPVEAFNPTAAPRVIAVSSMPFAIARGQVGVPPLSLSFEHPGGVGDAPLRVQTLHLHLEDSDGAGIVPSAVLAAVELGEGSRRYARLETLPDIGDSLVLNLNPPILVPAGEAVSVALKLDIAPDTIQPSFRARIHQAASIEAYDAVSGLRVSIGETQPAFPLRSGLGRIVETPDRVDLSAATPMALQVNQGQNTVELMRLELSNPGVDGLASDLRLAALGIELRDESGTLLGDLGASFAELRVRGIGQLALQRAPLAGEDGDLVLELSQALVIPPAATIEIVVEGDLSATAPLGEVHASLVDSTQIEVVDATRGSFVPAQPDQLPLLGNYLVVQGRAPPIQVSGAGTTTLPITIGAQSVDIMRLRLVHPGPAGTASVSIDSLRIDLLHGSGTAEPTANWLDRVAVVRGLEELAVLASFGATSSRVILGIPNLTLAPGDTVDLDIRVDFEPSSPTGELLFEVGSNGIAGHDLNDGQSQFGIRPDGGDLILRSGLVRLLEAADELLVAFEDQLPATLPADGSLQKIGTLHLSTPGLSDLGSIRLGSLRIDLTDRNGQPLVSAGLLDSLLLKKEGLRWAGAAMGNGTSATLTGPFASSTIAPGDTLHLELYAYMGWSTHAAGIRFSLDETGVGILQPGGGAGRARPVAAGGSFPLRTAPARIGQAGLQEEYANFPNPFAAGRGSTTFTYYLQDQGRVWLRIFDARGRAVRTLLDDVPLPPGLHQNLQWDGRNGEGLVVTNGVYVAELRVEIDGEPTTVLRHKVAVLR